MIDVSRVRGIIFDYGGTIDSNGVHWAEVIWQAYQAENIPITKEQFREAYIYGERTLGKNPIIQPHHTFLDMLKIKIEIQYSMFNVGASCSRPLDSKFHNPVRDLILVDQDSKFHNPVRDFIWVDQDSKFHNPVRDLIWVDQDSDLPLPPPEGDKCALSPAGGGEGGGSCSHIADRCYAYARASVENARPVIEWLAGKYPLVMVTNFYGNMRSVLKDFQIDHFFPVIIESATAGVRKPDPQIFRLGVEALQLPANEVVVIGDSYDKDIVPAKTTGCQTIWLKNTGWNAYTGNETADLIISDFAELKKML